MKNLETSTLRHPEYDCGQWAIPVVAGVGDPGFHTALLLALRDAVAADHLSHVCYGINGSVQYSSSASLLNQSLIESTTRVFVEKSFYRRDPNYGLLRDLADHPKAHPHWIVNTRTPQEITDREYRNVLFEQPGFASKISLISTHVDSINYMNLYFSRTHQPAEAERLQQRAPLLLALSHRHWQMCARLSAVQPSAVASWAEGLSLREIQVADLLRQGYTAKQVGRVLNLSPTTVITYKQRIFKKCQVENLKAFLLKVPSMPQANHGLKPCLLPGAWHAHQSH